MVDLRLMIQDVCIQARVHSLARTASGEGSAPSEDHLHCCQSIYVRGLDAWSFPCQINVIELALRFMDKVVTS